jgi:APA family basic amino acid/polyamine antiporter
MGALPASELALSTAPFADAAARIWGSWAGSAIALGAAVAAFGALNGWIMLQGQMPLAAAKDGLFPELFGRVSKRGTPVQGLILSSVLVTLLIGLNYSSSLVDQFTFIILLSTLSVLIPYVFSALAEFVIFARDREKFSGERLVGASIIGLVALLYSLWAIVGTGRDVVFWGFLLLLAGVPVFWLQVRKRDRESQAG